MKKFLITMLFFLFLVPTAYAEKTVKTINYFGGYFDVIQPDTFYSKNTTITFVDGVSEIIYARAKVSIDIDAAKTKVYAKIGNEYCTPEFYEVEFKDRKYELLFDCTDLIQDEGVYELGVEAGEVAYNAYIEWTITYLNNPFGSFGVFGTEYYQGEYGTVFLQLKDNARDAVNDGNCYLSIHQPNTPNTTHSPYMIDAPMLHLNGSDGLYYYDLYVPNVSGVYMMSAECSYVYSAKWYYPPTFYEPPFESPKTNRTEIYGDWIGDTFNLNDYEDWIYTQCNSETVASVGKLCKAYYEYTIEDTNISALDLHWMGESDVSAYLEFYVYNWTDSSYIKLTNDHTLSGTGYNYPIGIDELVTNMLPDLNNTIAPNNSVRILVNSTFGSTFFLFDNWLSLKATQQGEFITDLKGSGEMHVHEGNISVDLSSLENLTIDVNSSIYDKLYIIQEEITSVNDTVKNITFPDQVNYTYFDEKFNHVFENQTNIYSFIDYVNASIFGKLHLLQDDFEATWVNQTKIWELLVYMNSTEINYTYFNEQFNLVFVNQTEIYDTVVSHNATVMWKLYAIQDEMVSVNDTIKDEANTIINNQWTTYNWLQAFNTTVYGWHNITWTKLDWWGNHLNNTMTSVYNLVDWWGWELENKIDSIILGNVSVTAIVDYDEIALTVMQYLYALERVRII